MLITKKFSFDAAHKLKKYRGKCKNLHGHTYVLYVTIEGKIKKKSGMVIDFDKISQIVKKEIIDVLDHNYINRKLKQPTAENISVWIWNKLIKYFKIYKIELRETPDSYVTYYGK